MDNRTTQKGLSASVENFASLPDTALLDIGDLQALTSKSRPTIYRWIDAGIVPKPRKFGPTRNFWTAGELRSALGL